MKIILLSGGSGKRLWPLSNATRSKQFLRILRDPWNNPESMLQRIWRQLGGLGLKEHCLAATSASQAELIQEQLGSRVPIVVEPERRDTFAAIALSSAYLYSMLGAGLDETVVVLPVDAFVEPDFYEKVLELDEVLEKAPVNLGLVGVAPTSPSEKYGYIVPERPRGQEAYYRVRSFHEKPSAETASLLIRRHNAHWNCGVFAFKLRYAVSILRRRQLPVEYAALARQYASLKKISFDYEVVEQEPNVAMVPYRGSWKDLGTWNSLTEELSEPLIGRGTISEDSVNTHLINELAIPVHVLGMPNAVIVVSPDGILVADKAASPRLKELPLDGGGTGERVPSIGSAVV
ncbi:sugar phosphate nucleotidyltransferase [Cohnella hongkongensis]|uniref:Sugar phosphate nucleotidyltransferase n=1 Tax=Cohnella hongkongensis TaxID=178337 RepID=A0ABV9F9E7_9BACL